MIHISSSVVDVIWAVGFVSHSRLSECQLVYPTYCVPT